MELKVSGPNLKEEEIEIKDNITVNELLQRYKDKMPYPIYVSKVNNAYRSLTHVLYHDSKVEFLDIRNSCCWLVYQNGLTMLYLKAVQDILGPEASLELKNSINKGIYTRITPHPSNEEIKKIEDRMRELVKMDLPIVKEHLTRHNAIALSKVQNLEMTEKLLESIPNIDDVEIYSLDKKIAIFYGLMVPSTGTLKLFELMPYKSGILLRYPHQTNPNAIPEFVEEKLLYEAFKESNDWGKLMDIKYVSDLNEKVIKGEVKDMFLLQEALHEKRISDIADDIKDKGKRIVLICGPSSSGKTTFAKRLCIQLRVNGLNTLYLGTDDYFVEADEKPIDPITGELDLETIKAVDTKLLISNLNDLLAGKCVDLPYFDFIKNTKVFGTRLTTLKKDEIIVIEGIHALNKLLTEGVDDNEKYKIYISPFTPIGIDQHNRIPTTDARLLRRLVRDHQFRGRDAKTVLKEWVKVRESENVNIFPYNSEADCFFNSNCIYELSVLKKYAEPLLRQIDRSENEYAEAQRILNFLKYIDTINDDSSIVSNSIMREFIGGSIIVE